MFKIIRTRRARRDLLDIWLYIADDDPEAADALLDVIDAKCGLLRSRPYLGPTREDIRPGMRCLPVGQYLVLYEVAEQTIRIVLHGRRDLDGVFAT